MRHFTRDRSPFRVRLACVKHAASVQSEPESNSPVQICSKDLRWTEIRISKFLPVRYSLVNEPHRFTRREAVVYAASFSLSTSFFHFRESFFSRPRRGNSLARGRLMSHFQTRVKNFFCHPGKFLFPSPFRTWPARWRERLYAPFRPHRQAFFPQKILWIYALLTDYSINIPKRHRKMFAFFQATYCPPKKVPLQAMPEWGPRNASPLPFPHLRYSATKTPAEPPWQLPLPAHRWRELPMTAL